MSSLAQLRPHRVSVLAAAVVASVMLVPTTPAQAAPTGAVTGGTASWGLSTYLNSSTQGRPNPLPSAYVLPSTFDATSRISTWGTSTGVVDHDGSAALQLDGMTVNFAATSGAWLRLADVEATLDESGNGTVTALVSYGRAPGAFPNITYDPNQAPQRGPTRLTLVDLAGNTAADRVVTPGTATWTGLDGSWSTQFTTFLNGDAAASPAIPAWVYAGQVSSATDRTPLPFSFAVQTTVPQVTAAITGSSFLSGVTVDVDGTGFRAVTNPGDAGVYVGLAPSGGLPDVSTQAGMAAFAAAQYVSPAGIADGALSVLLNAPTNKLDPTKTYSVYTWQAHTQSNTSQDTETPVTIDFSTLQQSPSTTTPAGPASTPFGAGATLTAAVSGPGTVTLTGVGPAQTATVSGGSATFSVPSSLAVGTYTAAFAYSGGGAFLPSQATKQLTVTKASPGLGSSWKQVPSTLTQGRLLVSADSPAGVTRPTGKVVVTVSRKGVKHTLDAVLVDGKKTVKLPLLTSGTWKIKISYPGDSSYDKAKLVKKISL